MKKEFSLSTLLLLLLLAIICVALYFALAAPKAEAPATAIMPEEESVEDPGRLDMNETIEELVGSPIDLSFAHTAPGEYSEITVRRRGVPGDEIRLEVTSEESGYSNVRTVTADENGEILEVFRIFQFGQYWVQSDSVITGTRDITSITVN